ncbi:unnamed protein product [Lathyrus sativus]|nr:unnamed protein product [Lathyrus sativus]
MPSISFHFIYASKNNKTSTSCSSPSFTIIILSNSSSCSATSLDPHSLNSIQIHRFSFIDRLAPSGF